MKDNLLNEFCKECNSVVLIISNLKGMIFFYYFILHKNNTSTEGITTALQL